VAWLLLQDGAYPTTEQIAVMLATITASCAIHIHEAYFHDRR
jgi:hypothetical protein